MKLLIHGLNYAPEMVGIGKYTTEMAEWFAGRGHSVTVHAARPYYPQWKVFPDYSPERDSETVNGVAIRRHKIYVPEVPGGRARLQHHFSWLTASWGPVMASAQEERPDAVIAIAPSLIGAPAAARAAKRLKVPSIVHVQDFEVGAAEASGLIKSKALLSAAVRVERAVMGQFDYATTISQEMLKRLHAMGFAGDRTAIVRNWANVDAIQPKPAAESRIRAELGLTADKVVCLYSGTITNKQGLEILFEAARRLQGRGDIHFLVFGEGPKKAEFESLASDMPHVTFGPFQPVETFSDLLAAADIHMLPQIAGAADLVLPSKLTGMLASGRPVIATTAPGTGLAREIEGCGVAVEPGAPDLLAAAIEELADAPERRALLGKAARQRAEAVWAKDAILEEFESRLAGWAGARAEPAPVEARENVNA